jgi:hypothetical protein
VALQNPYSGGRAVYTARVMLDIIVDDFANEDPARLSHDSDASNDLGTLYPNPTTGNTTYRITLKKGNTGTLEIYDAVGKQLLSYHLQQGDNELEIQSASFSSGMYTCKLKLNGSFVSASKLTVVR